MLQNSMFFLLIQLFLSLLCIQFFSPLFDKLKAPRVFAEIFSGLILGPTIFKNISPYFYQLIFESNQQSLIAFSGIQELGLLLLMFCSGLEVELLTKDKEKSVSLYAGLLGVAIPFAVALSCANLFHLQDVLGENGDITSIKYFFAVTCSITSIPVISRIFIDLKLIHTRFANLCLSIALIEDLILYVIMALFIRSSSASSALSYLNYINIEKGSTPELALHVFITCSMIFFCFRIFPSIILKVKEYSYIKKIFSNYLTFSFLILLFVSIVSSYIGIPSFLGPFLAGIIVARTPLQNSEHLLHIKRFSFSTFIPLFFVGIGLKLDLFHYFNFSFFIIFIIFSSIIKILGVTFSGVMSKIKFKDAANLGFTLNARGGPGIVLASIGLSSKLINHSYFVTLVLAAILTSWFAAFWINFNRKHVESFKL